MIKKLVAFTLLLHFAAFSTGRAAIDTLRVLSYSILYLGDTPPCQGPHDVYEGYLEGVISYANPDIVGFVKREAEGAYGTAPTGFADSLLKYTLNAAYPGRYAYCPYTNVSEADNISTLYYNQQKLGSAGLLCGYSNITDFDTYKLYYLSSDLASTHDTIFLYVTLNHTSSGTSSGSVSTRAEQIAGEMAAIESHFTVLPNMINMGDFNTHTSTEACYQTLVAPSNSNYKYYDPPFYPDGTYSYPADWDADPTANAACLTVSTRETSDPNGCSSNTSGGFSWYDHIFLSASIINEKDHISYQPNTFKVIGNDGHRLGVAVNSAPTNTSAPSAVINDVFQLSEHYPIMLNLLVDTSAKASVPMVAGSSDRVKVVNPIGSSLDLVFPSTLAGADITVICTDLPGREQMHQILRAVGSQASLPCTLAPGTYILQFYNGGSKISDAVVVKK